MAVTMNTQFTNDKPINLTKVELIDVTMRTRKKSQLTALLMMGIPCRVRPDGSPLVSRIAFEQSMGGAVALSKPRKPQPKFESLKNA